MGRVRERPGVRPHPCAARAGPSLSPPPARALFLYLDTLSGEQAEFPLVERSVSRLSELSRLRVS